MVGLAAGVRHLAAGGRSEDEADIAAQGPYDANPEAVEVLRCTTDGLFVANQSNEQVARFIFTPSRRGASLWPQMILGTKGTPT